MELVSIIKINLSKGDFVLNQYLEIVRRRDYVTLGYLNEDYCFVNSGRAKKLEILFIKKAISKSKEEKNTMKKNKKNMTLSMICGQDKVIKSNKNFLLHSNKKVDKKQVRYIKLYKEEDMKNES